MREPAERESEAYEGWATRIVPAYPAVRSSFRAGWFARHDEAPESPFDTASPTPWHEQVPVIKGVYDQLVGQVREQVHSWVIPSLKSSSVARGTFARDRITQALVRAVRAPCAPNDAPQ